MTFRETFRLAHCNLVASRKRSVATIIAVGILFGVLLGLVLVLQGLENESMRYCVSNEGSAEMSAQDASLDKAQRYFEEKKRAIGPAMAVILVVAAIVLAFTMAHVVSQNAGIFAIYRAVGASRWQIFGIYFVYLLEVCFWVAVFAVGLSLVLALIVTVISGDYLTSQLRATYPMASVSGSILIGMNWQYLQIVGCIFLISPVVLLLCLDQFSAKKLAFRLKEE